MMYVGAILLGGGSSASLGHLRQTNICLGAMGANILISVSLQLRSGCLRVFPDLTIFSKLRGQKYWFDTLFWYLRVILTGILIVHTYTQLYSDPLDYDLFLDRRVQIIMYSIPQRIYTIQLASLPRVSIYRRFTIW